MTDLAASEQIHKSGVLPPQCSAVSGLPQRASFSKRRKVSRRNGPCLYSIGVVTRQVGENMSGRRLEKELASQFPGDAGCFVPADSVRDVVGEVFRDTSGCTHSARSHIADVNAFRISYVHGLQLCSQRVGDGLEKQAMDSVATGRSSAFRAPDWSARRRNLTHALDFTRNDDLSWSVMLATNTGRSLLLTLATSLAVCGSFKPTIAASPYPVGYSFSICSARERTNCTASRSEMASAATAAEKAPTERPATATGSSPLSISARAVPALQRATRVELLPATAGFLRIECAHVLP